MVRCALCNDSGTRLLPGPTDAAPISVPCDCLPAFDSPVREILDARVFISEQGNGHIILITPENAMCTSCRNSTCHLISHARFAMAPFVPEFEVCPRCGGAGEREVGVHQDRDSGAWDTA